MSATLVRPPDDLRVLNGAAPERSLQQRFDALAEANRIRTARARMKVEMKAGRKAASQILADPPEYVATMKVFNLLLAIPKHGRVKTNKILGRCKISPAKSVGGLTERQRQDLLRHLHGR